MTLTVVVRWSSIPEALAMARTDTDMAELIGRRIREARLAAGLTMEGLAEHLSVDHNFSISFFFESLCPDVFNSEIRNNEII